MFGLEATQIAHVAGALLVYGLAVTIPGPSFVVITKNAISQGAAAAGVCAAVGTTLGSTVYAIGTLLGLSAVLSALPWLLDLIQTMGGVYLSYIGIRILVSHLIRRRNAAAEQSNRREVACIIEAENGLLLKAFLIAISNPKIAIFFLSLFAPVAGAINKNTEMQLITLIGIVLIDFAYHQTLARLAAIASSNQSTRSINKLADVTAGSIMTIFGGTLIIQIIYRIYR